MNAIHSAQRTIWLGAIVMAPVLSLIAHLFGKGYGINAPKAV